MVDDLDPGRQHQGRLRQDHGRDPSGGGVRRRGPQDRAGRCRPPALEPAWARLRPARRRRSQRSTGSMSRPPAARHRAAGDRRRRGDEEEARLRAGPAGRCDHRAGAASAFDQSSTAAFLDRLSELKSIRKSRKPIGILRNRVRPRTRAAARLLRFLPDRARGSGRPAGPHGLQRGRGRRPLDLRSAGRAALALRRLDGLLRYVGGLDRRDRERASDRVRVAWLRSAASRRARSGWRGRRRRGRAGRGRHRSCRSG